jgi:hypothetical protein
MLLKLIVMYAQKMIVLNNVYFWLQAAYIINGNCKNVMNMSQPDQVELWRSVLNGMSTNF